VNRWNRQDFVWGQLLFSAVCGLLIFIIVMAGEFLHYASGGRIPSLIEWHPPPRHEIKLEDSDDEEESEDEQPAPLYFTPYFTP